MAAVTGLQCIRCGARYGADHYAEDCPACRSVARSNLVVTYPETMLAPRARPAAGAPGGLWRYGDLLPVARDEIVSLGEGTSPMHRLDRAGASIGVKNLFGKDETRNPTWSFKDRLACMAVSSAKRLGAEVIVSSSSGNAGAAAAAYAAKAGLRCVVFTFKGAAGPMLTQMRAYGATVVVVEEKADRWTLMEHAVRNYGWFPTSPFFGPVAGSNPYGIEGYKTLAYEIAEQLDWRVPDWCVLPVCYGDALYGMWKGSQELRALDWIQSVPRFVAAEVSGSLTAAMASGDAMPPEVARNAPSIAASIGAAQATVQGLDVLRHSQGAAVTVDDDEMRRWVLTLATKEGIWPEASSAAPFAAIERLRAQGIIKPHERCVALLTASGMKDPGPIEKSLPQPPLVTGGLTDLVAALENSYGFAHG
jgi:threonine synthase